MSKTFVVFSLFITTAAFAGGTESYVVSGPVVEVKDHAIVIQKRGPGRQKVEIERNSETKVTGSLKVGSMVKVSYRMVADGVEAKPPVARPGKTGARWESDDKSKAK